MKNKKKSQLFLWIGICLLIGYAGSADTASSISAWYAGLQKPPLNPPSWVFAPIWTLLYLCIGTAGWIIWDIAGPEKIRTRVLFAVQLTLNGIWSFLFFGLRHPWIAFSDILILWVCIGVLIRRVWRTEKIAGLLLVPYFLWVSFAAYLNAAIAWLNR